MRRDVFRRLHELGGVEIFAAMRRKAILAQELAAHLERTGNRLEAEHVYDGLVAGLFQNRLHLADENHIVFARRKKADRNVARVVDYYLWALQRAVERGERGERRFFDYLATAFKLVIDVDDTRRRAYGGCFTASGNPLRPERLMPVN